MGIDFGSLSQERLILLIQHSGDGDAYSVLVKPHRKPLLAFLTRLTGNPSSAEDIGQETMLKAYMKIATFQAQSSFKTWLFGIAYKEFLQAQRKLVSFTRLVKAVEDLVRSSHVPDIGAEMDIQKALNRLSHTERAAILLSEAYGLSHSEVANTMNAPLGTVKTYITRAKQKMSNAL